MCRACVCSYCSITLPPSVCLSVCLSVCACYYAGVRLVQVQGTTVVVTAMPTNRRPRLSQAADTADKHSPMSGRRRSSSASSVGSRRSIAGSVYSLGQSSLGDSTAGIPNTLLLHMGDGVLRLRDSRDGDGGDAGPLPAQPLPLGKLVTTHVLPCESEAVAEDARQWLQTHVDEFARATLHAENDPSADPQFRKLVLGK
jgi:hypothetical protein